MIDILTGIVALAFAFRLEEPHHRMDVEKREAGVLVDAWKLLKNDTFLLRAALGRALFFIAGLAIWRVHQDFFVRRGISIVLLGFLWSIMHLAVFTGKRLVNRFRQRDSVERRIHWLNLAGVATRCLFFLSAVFVPTVYFLLPLFFVGDWLQVITWPLYSELFHKRSLSHNRATTVSLCHFVKSFLDIPFFLFASYLISMNIAYLFLFSFALVLVVPIFFRLPEPKIST